MSGRPVKKLKRQASGNKGDETERALAQHKESLHEKMMSFLEVLPQLTARYNEAVSKVRQENPFINGTKTDRKPHAAVTEAKDLPRPPCNSVLLRHLAALKAESLQLSKQLLAITEWITLMIPTIKDEDNAGVEVQMQVQGELVSLAKEIEGKYDLEFEYLEARAGIESKYYKHFLAPTWALCIEKLDQNRWDDLDLAWKELVRIVLSAYTLLVNNMEKLKNPRSSAHASYMTM
eukprot:TRINITY_DN39692_c0_g1_i1.p1 TRINITY_DN39692_c0_g1~~TRINITY_DN39692_c0_g1_i1.p1  ORF type:complete len:234 (+),score=81.86 TRINITY_DN39692_c0_g1_i1:100-801(+)